MEGAGRYRLVRLIKRGGMAELFEGRIVGEQGFQRRVAIKRLLFEHASDPVWLDAFVAEARLLGHLHHANIVGVFDFGLMDGIPFQALELVDGLDLRTVLDLARDAHTKPPIEMALHIASEIASALEYAHEAEDAEGTRLGIVHRDVTPENILLSFAGEVKIADFGIARSLERSAGSSVAIAEGKLAYMAPEHQRGERIDHRADIFSLGCVLCELLTGRSPLGDEAARREVLAGGSCTIDPDLSDDVREIVVRATESARGSRFESASAMGQALRAALAPRASGDRQGRTVLREFLRRFKEAEPKRAPHPLEALMDVELVLKDAVPAGGVRRFESVVRADATEREEAIDSQVTEPGPPDDTVTAEIEKTPILSPVRQRTLPVRRPVVPERPRRRPGLILWTAASITLFAAALIVWMQDRAAAPEELSPAAIAPPAATARLRPEASQEHADEPSAEPLADPPRPSDRAQKRSDGAIKAALAERGLTEEDLDQIETTRALARALSAARAKRSKAGLEQAEEQLARAIRALPRDARALQAQLLEAKDALARSSSSIAPERLEALEHRYLDLRAAFREEMTPLDRAKLSADVAALTAEIRAVSR